jgi:hypothetical protein
MKNKVITFFAKKIFLLPLFLLILVISFVYVSSPKGAYLLGCDSSDSCSKFSSYKEFYISKSDQNIVVKSTDSIEKYQDCTIIDNENWSCFYNDHSGTFNMINGIYQGPETKGPYSSGGYFRAVPKWKWLLYGFKFWN